MNKQIMRILTLALCIVMAFTMLPVTADAAGSSYSTLSSAKVLLEFPESWSMLSEPLHAKVDNDYVKGGIYYLPKPETGNGNLGVAKKGTNVTIFAEDGLYYFFMTNSGRMGWSKKVNFTEPEEYEDYELPGDSGLTIAHLEEIKDYLSSTERAGGSNKFFPEKPVVFVKKGETVKVIIRGNYKTRNSIKVSWWGDYCTAKFVGSYSRGKATVSIHGDARGSEFLSFSNTYTEREFDLLVIVL